MLQCLPSSFFLRLAIRQSRFTVLVLYALLALLLLLFTATPLYAKEPPSTPFLRIEPELHTAAIRRMAVDQAERYVVTASHDKTARVWDAKTGKLLQILRPPIADGGEGKVYAVAISPNGEQIAVAGWTGEWEVKDTIYIFKRSTAEIIQRIQGLPNVVKHLAYSPNGKVLVASLFGGKGIRFYQQNKQGKQSKQGKYQQVAEDTDYGSGSYCIDFDKDGNSVSTSDDGYIRLYNNHFKKIQQKKAPSGKQPFFARFSPNGKRIAVGFADNTAIDILSADNLSKLDSPNTTDFDNGSLNSVAWSYDGTTLYAGGVYDNGKGNPVAVWNSKNFASAHFYHAAQTSVMDIHPLHNGDVLFASADPAVGRLDKHGKMLWKQGAGMLEYSGYTALRDFRLNSTGQTVGFHYKYENQQGKVIKKIAQWNSETLALNHPDSLDKLSLPLLSSKLLDIQDWQNEYHPRLNGKPLNLKKYERSRSLAISSSSSNKEKPVFALGTDWYVRLYNAQGELQWEQAVPIAWAVNITADNRYVVAALGDGTIRWYQLNNGKERLAFYLHPDDVIKNKSRWIAWTPEGFYATSSKQEESLIGFHINQGADKAGRFVAASQLHEVFARADLVAKALGDKYPKLAAKALQKAGDIQQILSAGLAPRILLQGKKQRTLTQREFDLSFDLVDQGGGIGKLEYRVDGKLMSSGSQRAYAPRSRGSKGFKRTFTLEQGKHIISVTAYNKQGLVASTPVEVDVTVIDPVHREPSLYVLSVGITNYRDKDFNLKYAADDAIDFAAALQKSGRKLFKAVHPKVLVDQEATLNGIGAAFEAIAQKAQAQDVFVFYLAGHGMVADGRYQFIPYDLVYENEQSLIKQALNENKLKQLIASVETAKRMMILDSCHAGKALPTLAALSWSQPRGMADKGAISRLMNATGIAILAATSKDQEAKEGIIENGEGHGVFTHVLLKGLRGAAETEGNKDGEINVEELISYARKEVPRISMEKWHYEQFPMFQSPRQDFPIGLVK